MQFEWDPEKARRNLLKHGIAFEDAMFAFYDPFRVTIQDRHENGEERWKTTGVIKSFTIVVVAHTTWDDEQGTEVIRIISARRAEPHERRAYERE